MHIYVLDAERWKSETDYLVTLAKQREETIMPSVPEFVNLLDSMKAIHQKKNDDYAGSDDAFENFKRSAQLMSWFKNEEDKAFINLIATKLARLATLLNKEGTPNNESIQDSFLDLTTYCALWSSYYERERSQS